MKSERKLKLLSSPAQQPEPFTSDADNSLSPASADEMQQAQALAEAIASGSDPLANALKLAAVPHQLDDADHDALLARALGDDNAPPTKVELKQATELRTILEQGAGDHPDAALVEALRAAWKPATLSEIENQALIARSLKAVGSKSGQRRITSVTMVTLSTLAAIAAGVALLLGQAPQPSSGQANRDPLIPARSTTDLFDATTPFPREGGETARIDAIARSRASDLRQNRYASWGIR